MLERKAGDGKQRGAAQMGARDDDRQSAEAGRANSRQRPVPDEVTQRRSASACGSTERPTARRRRFSRHDAVWTEEQRADMAAAAKLQQSERLEAAALHRLLRGRSKKKRSAARRRRREKRLRTTDVEARLESGAAVPPIGRASEKLTTASGDRQDVSTAASEFIGHDVLFMKPGASRRNKVRAVTWNAGKGVRGNKFDFCLDYITGKEDERGERPGFDFAAVQELGPSWSSGGQAWLWQRRSGEACVRKAPPLRETRAPQSAKQRRKAYQKLIASEDDPLPATNTGWRAHFTQHAMLAWRTEWESRRRG